MWNRKFRMRKVWQPRHSMARLAGIAPFKTTTHSRAMTPVSIREVSKSYDGVTPVLDRVSLDIAAGEMFFLLGGSGCGKTTLLRLVAGFIAPDSGTIRFANDDVTQLPVERRDLGMVFQNYALWPHLSVAENISFGLEMRRVVPTERARRVDEALGVVELSGFGARRIAELSGGQQQRVALARALVIRPQVLLLDEPLSNLDARLRQTMRVEIRRICKAAGVTAIYVTHDREEALSTADRIAVMAGGRLAQVGTPRQVYGQPASTAVATFLGDANLLPGMVRDADTAMCALGVLPAFVTTGAISGTICAQAYLGGNAAWTIRCGSTELQVVEQAPPSRAIGDVVYLSITRDDVVVLRT
jgi:iron(III) transport system ATP-binding protein